MITTHDVKRVPCHGIVGLQNRLILWSVECQEFEINDPKPDWVFGTGSKVIARVPNFCDLRKGGKTAAKLELNLYKQFYPEIIKWLLNVR